MNSIKTWLIVDPELMIYWFEEMGRVGGDSGLGGVTTGGSLLRNCLSAKDCGFIWRNCDVIDGELVVFLDQ